MSSGSSISPAFPLHGDWYSRLSILANCTDTGVPLPSSNFPRLHLQAHAASQRARRCGWQLPEVQSSKAPPGGLAPDAVVDAAGEG